MPQPAGAREATPLEVAAWDEYKSYYDRVLAPAVLRAKTAAEIANEAQRVVDKHNIKGLVFDSADMARIGNLLNRANILGRYISAVEAGKYGIRLSNGDIDIMAPSDMPADEYAADLYPAGLGIAVIIWVIVAGVLIGGALWLVSKILKDQANKIQKENEQRLIAADIEMMKQPDPARRDWIDMKKATKPAAKEAGILAKFFGSDISSAIGIGLLVFAGLLILPAFLKPKTKTVTLEI